MIPLKLTTDTLDIITSAACDVHVIVGFIDADNTTPTAQVFVGDRQGTAITTATTTPILSAPASSHFLNGKLINVRNRHATTPVDVTPRLNLNGTAFEFDKVTLLAGEKVVFNSEGTYLRYDASGGVYGPSLPVASDTVAGAIQIAAQSDQEAGTSTLLAVTSGRQHFHPSAVKAWLVAGVTGNILASYNITSLTDTGTGDIAVTIATDFSSANYSVTMSVQRINSTAAEANSRIGTIKTASLAAGSFSGDCWDGTATTNVIKDPTTWHFQCCGDHA